MGSIHPPKKEGYAKNTRIDADQSYQLAYWKDRFGVSEEELVEAVRAAGGLARNVGVPKTETSPTLMLIVSRPWSGVPTDAGI